MNGQTSNSEIFSLLDRLWHWANSVESLGELLNNPTVSDYVAWKFPFPMEYIDKPQENIGLRVYCVQSLFQKLHTTVDHMLNSNQKYEFCRAYSIVTEPNMFGSEVGIFFSEKKWEQLLFRDVDTNNFREKTKLLPCLLERNFSLSAPEGYFCSSFSHTIEDEIDEVYFDGLLHVIWRDLG